MVSIRLRLDRDQDIDQFQDPIWISIMILVDRPGTTGGAILRVVLGLALALALALGLALGLALALALALALEPIPFS